MAKKSNYNLAEVPEQKKADIIGIFDRITDAFIALDTSWHFTYVNKKAAEIFGISPDYLLGKVKWEVFPGAVGTPLYQAFHKALKEQHYVYNEAYNAAHDVWLENHIYPSPEGLSVYFRDITYKKKAALALKESEERYRSLVENAPDIILIADLDYTVRFVNHTDGGYNKEEVTGRNVFDFLPAEYHREVKEIFRKIVTDKVSLTYETAGYDKNGKKNWYFTNAGPIITGDTVTSIALIIRENTDRKKTEKEIRRAKELLEETSQLARVGGWEMDIEKNTLNWTLVTKQIHETEAGFVPDLQSAINFYKEGENRDAITRVVQEAISTGKSFDLELQIITAKGNEKWVRAKGKGEMKGQKCIRISGTFQDINEKKINEIREQSRNQVLELLNNNAPLTSILDELILGAEKYCPGMLCSILLLDEEGKKLTVGSAPHLPDFYNKAIDGVAIGPTAGSCGAAAYTGQRVIAEDIQEHPNWVNYRELAEQAGLRACWSEPVKDANGKIWGTFASYYTKKQTPSENDIDSLKKSADLALIILEKFRSGELIKKRDQLFRSLVQNISDIITILDERGFVQFQSPSIKNILGFDEEELLGKHIFELLHPEDIAHVREAFENALAVPGIAPPVLFRIINKAGGYSNLEARGNNQLHNPSVRSIIVTSRDISDRLKTEETLRQSEEKYRLMIERNLAGVYQTTPEGSILTCNNAFANMLGYSSAAELLPQKASGFYFSGEDRADFIKQLLQNGGLTNKEAKLKHKNGTAVYIFESCSLINDPVTGEQMIEGVMLDITELKKTEAALKTSEANLQHVLSSTPEQFYVIDRNYRVILINTLAQKCLQEIWGVTVNQGADMVELLPAEKKELLKKNYDKCLTGEKIEYELSFSSREHPLWMLVRYTPVIDEKGAIKGVFVVTKDITEGKLAEEKLKRNFEQLQALSKLSEAVSQAKKTEEIYELAISSLQHTIKADRASVLLFDKDGVMQFVASSGLSDDYKKAAGGHSPWLQDAKDPVPIFITDANNEPSLSQLLPVIKKEGICALGFIPLIYQNRLLGKFMLYFNTTHQFTDEEIHLAETIARDVAFAIGEKKSEMVLRESENRLRTIMETDPECIKLLGPDCELYDINPAGLRMLEAESLEQIKGHSILPVVSEVHRKAAAKLIKDAFAGKSGRLEFEMITLKGNYRWCDVNVVPFRDADGKVINALSVTRDISERKKAETELIQNEKKYRTLVEQAVDAIALYDEKGNILDVNTGAINLLGYSRAELAEMSLTEILAEEELRDNPVRFDILKQGESTVKQRKMKRKDGSLIETEVRSQQLPDGRFLSVVRDMTERIKSEKDLEASYKAVRKLTSHLQNIREEERKHIAREIHDELGQQLTVLKMDISWLNKKVGAEADNTVKQKLKDLLLMLDGTVKTVRRISSELRPSLLDDLGLVAAMEWQLGEFEKRSGIKTSFTEPGREVQLPDHVKTGLFRIFQESLTNVARHAGAKKVKVSLLSAGNDFVLRIADDGKGFDKNKIADKKTLGILGMKERTTMIGGSYTIISAPEKGTTVVVTIPMDS